MVTTDVFDLIGIVGGIFGIVSVLFVVFWRGSSLTSTLTKAIVESERRLRAESQRAHDGIASRIESVDGKVEAVRNQVAGIDTNVAYIRGRLDERDRRTPAPKSAS